MSHLYCGEKKSLAPIRASSFYGFRPQPLKRTHTHAHTHVHAHVHVLSQPHTHFPVSFLYCQSTRYAMCSIPYAPYCRRGAPARLGAPQYKTHALAAGPPCTHPCTALFQSLSHQHVRLRPPPREWRLPRQHPPSPGGERPRSHSQPRPAAYSIELGAKRDAKPRKSTSQGPI